MKLSTSSLRDPQIWFNILSDSNWEVRLDQVEKEISIRDLNTHLKKYKFGSDPAGITIVLICRTPEFKFKQRIRFSKKNQHLYVDIMLDYNDFLRIDKNRKQEIIANKIITELPQIFKKYRIENLNVDILMSGLSDYLKKIKWMK